MRFNVLGPLEMYGDDGVKLEIRQAKQRALLMVMLLHANQVVGVSQLIDALWGEATSARSLGALRTHVWALRRLLAPDSRLRTAEGGYRLDVLPEELDVAEFYRLAGQGRHAFQINDLPSAAARLREALELWREPYLTDMPATVKMEAAARRMLDERQAVREVLTEVRLALGQHSELIPELRASAAADLAQERLWEQLMLALYRAGRTAEALAAYQEVRTLLADELGIEPGHGLQSLHRRILANDPALALGSVALRAGSTDPAPEVPQGAASQSGHGANRPPRPQAYTVPRQLPGSTRHFTGRTRELQILNEMLAARADPQGTVVVTAIGGTAGIGKTALALHWAHSMVDRFPDGQLYANLRGFGPSGGPLQPAAAIRAFLDAFEVPVDRIPADFDAQVSLYRSLLAGKRMVLFLDNAVDAAQVRPLLPASPSCPVLVTSRNQLSSLVATEGAHLLTLDLLSAEESGDLLGRLLGAERVLADPGATEEVVTLCARLPIALRIVAARATARPHLSLATLARELRGARRRLDLLQTEDPRTSVRTVFSWSCEKLSPPALLVFRLIGVHAGPDITAPACASLADITLIQAIQALDELVRAHLLTEHLPGRFACHDLLGAYASEQAAAHFTQDVRRAALRRSLDYYLHTAHAADQRLYPARDLIPLIAAGPGVTPSAFADRQEALAWFKAEHSVLLAAIEHGAKNEFDTHAWQLAWTLVTFQDRQGAFGELAAAQETALAAANQADDVAGQVQAHRMLGRAYSRLGLQQDAESHLSRALRLYQQLNDQEGEAHIHTYLGKVLESRGEYELALRHCERARTLFSACTNRVGQARALNSIGWCHIRLGNYEYALTCCWRAVDLHRELGNPQGEAHSWDSLGYAYHHLGRYAQAIDCYRRAISFFDSIDEYFEQANGLGKLGDSQCAAGDESAARDSWRQALSIYDDLKHSSADRISAKLRQLRG